ncbi:MAG: prohibitin family protein [Flavobacteriales bacterium]|nr:prohibitin family protein [Flavobacteriales bacterium]
MPEFPKNGKRMILTVVIGILFFIIMFKSVKKIDGGEGGVLFKATTGIDTENTYAEGYMFIAPWNDLIIYNVRQQEVMEDMAVLSSNGLEISLEVSTWYQPKFSELAKLHQEKGQSYLDQVVRPAIRSASRSVIGRYTPEEIYSTKRDAIQSEIYEETKKILDKQYIQINEILVRDITLPITIKTAIEGKLKQEQESLEYEFKLQKALKEAQKVKIEAEGKADANRILNASLTPNILKEKGIEATLELAKSPNSKVVIIGGKDGMPLILGNN